MNNKLLENRKFTMAVLVLLILALVSTGLYFRNSFSLKKELSQNKIQKELLLSEKLNLDKMINKLKKELDEQKGKNSSLDRLIEEISFQLNQKEAEVKRLLRDNATVKSLRKKITELEELRNQLNAEIALHNKSMKELRKENEDLNKELTALKTDYQQVNNKYTVLSNLMAANYMIEALKGKKDKLTLSARKTDKLVVSLELPKDVANTIKFKLLTPDGKEYSNMDEQAQIIRYPNDDELLAASQISGNTENKNERIEMIYKPKDKLIRGVYTFQIYSGDNYVASIQQRLK